MSEWKASANDDGRPRRGFDDAYVRFDLPQYEDQLRLWQWEVGEDSVAPQSMGFVVSSSESITALEFSIEMAGADQDIRRHQNTLQTRLCGHSSLIQELSELSQNAEVLVHVDGSTGSGS